MFPLMLSMSDSPSKPPLDALTNGRILINVYSRENLPANNPWPHQDQDPAKPGFRCLQGLVNLNPCGPNDGGLIVCKGGHVLSEQFHKEMADEPRIPAWTPEWFGFTDNGMKWLKDHGLEWEKVCAEPGDLIVWDSRTPHYNVAPTSQQDRLAVYTCFMPVKDATQEQLIRKKGAFESRFGLPPSVEDVTDKDQNVLVLPTGQMRSMSPRRTRLCAMENPVQRADPDLSRILFSTRGPSS